MSAVDLSNSVRITWNKESVIIYCLGGEGLRVVGGGEQGGHTVLKENGSAVANRCKGRL